MRSEQLDAFFEHAIIRISDLNDFGDRSAVREFFDLATELFVDALDLRE